MNGYIANGNMYGRSYTFSSPFSNMHTEPFKTSVNELYNYMLRRCLNRTKGYDEASTSLEFALLRQIQEGLQSTNPLSIIKEDNAYYFNDSKEIRRIDKYESS